jgi:hypothetical protein
MSALGARQARMPITNRRTWLGYFEPCAMRLATDVPLKLSVARGNILEGSRLCVAPYATARRGSHYDVCLVGFGLAKQRLLSLSHLVTQRFQIKLRLFGLGEHLLLFFLDVVLDVFA